MGCDIHAHLEMKADSEWNHIAEVYIRRNYEFFGKLAGVRGGYALIEPRGVPEDISWGANYEYREWSSDAHTPHWLTCKEFFEAMEDCHFRTGLESFFKTLSKSESKYRVVFWFDN